MSPEIVPPNLPDIPPAPTDTQRGKSITCECCGSRLDRHGNLLRRGDLAKQMIDAEDTIADLRKHVQKAADDLTAAKARIMELEAVSPSTKRKPIWAREA
jgi:hypothetical protein